MALYLHISDFVERQLAKMSDGNKNADLAVLKCKQLLSDIREYGLHHDRVVSKRTKKGEQRIKNCVKYDMGSGYRLVTVLCGDYLYVTFLGSHDETDLWFDRHKGDDFTKENPNHKLERIHVRENLEESQSLIGAELVEVDDYEAELESKLDEAILLSIFQGLYRSRKDMLEENI
jgi:hypothetical protein